MNTDVLPVNFFFLWSDFLEETAMTCLREENLAPAEKLQSHVLACKQIFQVTFLATMRGINLLLLNTLIGNFYGRWLIMATWSELSTQKWDQDGAWPSSQRTSYPRPSMSRGELRDRPAGAGCGEITCFCSSLSLRLEDPAGVITSWGSALI